MSHSAQQERGVTAMAPSPAIPRHFHFIWFGGKPPSEYAEYQMRWLDLHPGWGIRFWDEETLPKLYNQDLFDHAEEIAPGSEGQFRSDIARLEILYAQGGVYVDFDMDPQHNIEPLLDGVAIGTFENPYLVSETECFFAWEEQGKWINNAIMGATPKHPFIAALITGLRHRVTARQNVGVRPNVLSGPQYITAKYEALKPDITIFPQPLFYPYLWNELDKEGESFPQAYAIHRWNNKRKQRG